jgi:alkylhydroperoxidase family enzyme
LNAWHESELYTDRERAALTWAEALTNVAEGHAPDSDYEVAQNTFSKGRIRQVLEPRWALIASDVSNDSLKGRRV